MDTDDHLHSGHHRPPILFQSDEHEHEHEHQQEQDHHRHGHGHHHNHHDHLALDEHVASHPRSLRHRLSEDTLTHLDHDKEQHEHQHQDQDRHPNDYLWQTDETPPHVHSQACEDSCPVQDIYTEAGYFRFSKGARTNLYGLAVLKELGTTAPSSPTGSQPTAAPVSTSIGSSIFLDTGELVHGHLPGRYVLVAAGNSIKCFLGLQNTFDIPLSLGSGLPGEAGNTTAETPVLGNDGSVATAPAPNQEIVSIDAFERKDERGCQLVVVVSIAKAEDTSQFELRCYGANTFGSTIRELLLQLPDTTDIQTIPLSWAPTMIIHAPVEEDPFDMAILVGGSDSCVHLFVQDRHSETSKGLVEERPIESYLPVLASFVYCEYCVLSLVIKDYSTYRIVAAGTQNGTLNVGIIPRDPKTFQLQRDRARSYTVVLFAPITTLTVYTSRVQTEGSARRSKRPNPASGGNAAEHEGNDASGNIGIDEKEEEHEEEGIHLLVTCAIEQAWVYSDINKHGLGQRSDLAECSYHDSILAAHVMDADWDGRNEIMTGTYGRQLMVFKELPRAQDPFSLSSYAVNNNTPGDIMDGRGTRNYGHDPYPPTHPHQQYPHSSHPHHSHLHHTHHQQHPPQRHGSISASGTNSATHKHNARALQCTMTWNRRFASPIYGISSADLNDDGLEELVITTLNGVSFFLPDPLAAKQRLLRAVTRMQEIEEMKLTLEKLRQENEELQEARRVKEEKEKQQVKEKEARELEAKEKEAKELEEKQRKEREESEAKEREVAERTDHESGQREEHEAIETVKSEPAAPEDLEKAPPKEEETNDGVEERAVKQSQNEDEEQVENEDEKQLVKEDEEEEEDEEELKEGGEEAEQERSSEENDQEAETVKSGEELKAEDEEVKETLLKQELEQEEEETKADEEEQPEENSVVEERQSDKGVDAGQEQRQATAAAHSDSDSVDHHTH